MPVIPLFSNVKTAVKKQMEGHALIESKRAHKRAKSSWHVDVGVIIKCCHLCRHTIGPGATWRVKGNGPPSFGRLALFEDHRFRNEQVVSVVSVLTVLILWCATQLAMEACLNGICHSHVLLGSLNAFAQVPFPVHLILSERFEFNDTFQHHGYVPQLQGQRSKVFRKTV